MWQMKWALRAEAEEGAEGAPVAQGGESPPDDSKLWDDLLEEELGTLAEEPAEAEPVVEEVGREAEPEPVAKPESAPEPPPAATVVEKPVEVAQQPPAPVVSEGVAQEPPPAQSDEARQILRQKALESLAGRYALTEEDATSLQVEPEKVLPKLAANLHAAIYEEVLQRVFAEAPALVERTLKARDETHKAEEAFYSRWGQLRGREAEVNRVAMMWRQMYPKASMQEAIEGVGQSAMALLGLGAQAPVQAAPTPPPPPPPAGPSSRVGTLSPAQSKLSAEEQAFADLAKTFVEEY